MKKLLKKIDINIIIIIAISFIILIPMFVTEYKLGHDSRIHVTNVSETTDLLRQDIFMSNKIYAKTGRSLGYGTMIFYPPIPYTSTAIFNLPINSATTSMKWMHFIVLSLSGITMYYLSKRLSKNKKVALMSAIIYILFPYHLSEIYIRDAYAESFLFIFLPLILSSVYELFNGNKKKFYLLFVIGYTGGILCHLTLMIYFTILLAAYLLVRFKDTIKNLKSFIGATVLVFLIISGFVAPMIQHKFLGDYRVFAEGVMVRDHIQKIDISAYINFNVTEFNEIRHNFNIVTLILLVLTLINFNKFKSKKYYSHILIFSIVIMVLTLNVFPWDSIPWQYKMFQFAWRFQTFFVLLMSLLAPLIIHEIVNKKYLYLIIVMMTIFSFNVNNLNNKSIYSYDSDYNYEAAIGWMEEYLPDKLSDQMEYYEKRNKEILVRSGSGNVTVHEDKVPYMKFSIDNKMRIEFPRIYYLGYELTDMYNHSYDIYENDKGFIEAELGPGIYELKYKGTTIDHITKYISLGGFISWIIFLVRFDKKKVKAR